MKIKRFTFLPQIVQFISFSLETSCARLLYHLLRIALSANDQSASPTYSSHFSCLLWNYFLLLVIKSILFACNGYLLFTLIIKVTFSAHG